MGDSDGEVSGNIFDLPQSEPNLWYAVEYMSLIHIFWSTTSPFP